VLVGHTGVMHVLQVSQTSNLQPAETAARQTMTDRSGARGRHTFLPVLSMCHQQTRRRSLSLTTDHYPTFAARRYGKVQYKCKYK